MIYLNNKEINKRSRSLTTLGNLEDWVLRKRYLRDDKKYEIIDDIRQLYRSICSEICQDSVNMMYYVPAFRKYLKSIDLNHFKSVVYAMDIEKEIQKSIEYSNNLIFDKEIFDEAKKYIIENKRNIYFDFTYGCIESLENSNDVREIERFKLQDLVIEVIENNLFNKGSEDLMNDFINYLNENNYNKGA